MPVLFDLEWTTTADGERMLTQLAALRTDAAWQPGERFSALIAPAKEPDDWEHVAYNGYAPEEFRAGEEEKEALQRFARWLKPEDVLCCWHYQNGKTLAELYQCWVGPFSFRWAAANQKVYTVLAGKGCLTQGGLYACARLCGLEVPVPEHASCNDVAVLQSVLQALELPAAFLRKKKRKPEQVPVPAPERAADRREQTAKKIAESRYNYLFLADSPVFHRRECKLVLNSSRVLGSVHYGKAVQKRRPCKVCRPVRLTEEEETRRSLEHETEEARAARLRAIARRKEAAQRNEVLDTRLLGGQRAEIRRKLLVGCCHNHLHPGKLTRKLMEEHDCIRKECRFFEKYEDADYWREREEKAAARQQLREQKKRRKEQEAAVESHRDLFQEYADSTGSRMRIIRLQEETKNVFRVFYVSENPFRDGNRFPEFLEAVRLAHPEYRLVLRHIQDLDGHFVTLEEYERLRK